MKKKKILVADDYQMFRSSVTAMLTKTGKYEVFEASDGYEAVAKVDVYGMDAVLMDIEMPEKNGLEATSEIVEKFPETKILVLSGYFSKELTLKLLEAGAMGYILKDAKDNELMTGLDTILNGGYYFGSKPMQVIMTEFKEDFLHKDSIAPVVKRLSVREIEIIKHTAEGLTNKEIAAKLYLSKRTIDTHRQNIMSKLDVKNSAQLIYFAVQNKLI